MEITKKAISLSIFNLVNSLTQFLLVVLLSRFYIKADYGTFRQTFLPFESLAPLLSIGLTNSIFYYYPRFADKQRLIKLFLLIIGCTCLTYQLFFWVGGNHLIAAHFKNQNLLFSLNFVGIFAFFSLGNNLLYSFLILNNRLGAITYWNTIANVLILGLVSAAIFFHYNIYFPIGIRICCFVVLFLGLMHNAEVKIFKTDFKSLVNKIEVKEILTYSFPIAFSAVVGTVSYQLSSLIVSSYTNPETFAVYVNGAVELPFISIVTTSIATASLPAFSAFCKDEKFEDALRLFKKITLVSSLILFPLFVFCFVYAKEIVLVLFGKSYNDSYIVFRIYLCLMPIRVINYGNALMALGKNKTLVTRSIIELLLNVVLSFTLLHFFGYIGAAFGTVLSVLLWTVPFNLYTIAKGFKVTFLRVIPIRKMLVTLGISIASVIVVKLISPLLNFLNSVALIQLGVLAAVFFLLFAILLFVFKLVPEGTYLHRKFKRF